MEFYLQSLYQEVLGASIMFWPKFASGIFIFALFCFIYIIAGIVFDRMLCKNDSSQQNVLRFFRKATRVFLLVFGTITMLGTWGVDISAVVAGLGLTGFALGFALKDILASSLAGVLILIYKPFKINDKINACGAEGEVVSIDMRYTTIVSKGDKHLIPNSKLLSEKVTVLD